jgi:hypothetical protein
MQNLMTLLECSKYQKVAIKLLPNKIILLNFATIYNILSKKK